MKKFPPASYIEKIEIDGLFGGDDLVLVASRASDPRVMVLYGRNGTGKTTVLSIVRSLLSWEDNSGHRTRLSRIPFSRAAVTLSGGVTVEAKKKNGLTGSFDWSFRRRGGESIYIHLPVRDGAIRSRSIEAGQQEKLDVISGELKSVIPWLSYLDDKRTFYRASDEFEGEPKFITRRFSDGRVIRTAVPLDADDDDPVKIGLAEVTNSIRREALALSNRGNQDAQTIYTNLVRGLAAFPQSKIESKGGLKDKLLDLERRGAVVSEYGLSSRVDHSEIISVLKVSEELDSVLFAVLSPYVESLSARISAIEGLHSRIDVWTGHINNFIYPKRVAFKVGEGVSIISKNGDLLDSSALSSGERHLLVLMTKAFILRSTGGLMIIDEPELSLNSAWQRALIGALLDNFDGGACQLLIASHSLEICSQYVGSLVEMH
ncbi:AAA family ATPase [Stenotrophomonas sp.]|uniref:AAA family ATPase n=1 Tax=Stenotrophomonas sp. TaxID=69392 RepID=UPI0028AB1A2F|nr:AAA family ATPase [Stenotrophomonas sp.]